MDKPGYVVAVVFFCFLFRFFFHASALGEYRRDQPSDVRQGTWFFGDLSPVTLTVLSDRLGEESRRRGYDTLG
jgi:hypothetical protein